MDRLSRFSNDFHNHFTRNPNSCVFLGVDKNLDNLPDPSLEEVADTLAEAEALLATCNGHLKDSEDLNFDQKLDLELAKNKLETEIFHLSYTFNGRTMKEQLPRAGDDIGDGIFMMFINDPRPASERLENITHRMEKIPEYLQKSIQCLDTPIARWVTIEIEKVSGMSGLFHTIQGWAESENWPRLEALKSAREKAEEAIKVYTRKLAELPTTENLHAGVDTARKIVALNGIERSLEDLHQLATQFLANTRETIESLRGKLVKRYNLSPETSADELGLYLKKKFCVQLPTGNLGDVLARYEDERSKILSFIKAREMFPVFSDQDMKIMQTPRFMEPSIPAGAMVSPSPFRPGTKTSLVYLTLSEELLDEHTELEIPLMMIHEGIPGHHLQLATAAIHPSVIRRHVDNMVHGEGWTTMLEDYMLDQGYMGDLTDEARFCGKRDLSRLGARVAIDLFFMTGDRRFLDVGVDCDLSSPDPFVAAGNLLQTVTGFVPGRVQAELNWYSQERGYPLSYLTGNALVWEMKNQIIEAQSGRLEGLELDKRFHEIYLKSGNMPLNFLRRVFQHEGLLN